MGLSPEFIGSESSLVNESHKTGADRLLIPAVFLQRSLMLTATLASVYCMLLLTALNAVTIPRTDFHQTLG